MQRFPDWDMRLAAYLEPLRLRPFEWGDHDCCLFCAGAVEAMTGVDVMGEFRGRYSTALGSARALKKIGAGTLEDTLGTKFARVAFPLAHRGDLVMSSGLLGICFGSYLIAVGAEVAAGVTTREGLIRIERARWVDPIAWRVPYEA